MATVAMGMALSCLTSWVYYAFNMDSIARSVSALT